MAGKRYTGTTAVTMVAATMAVLTSTARAADQPVDLKVTRVALFSSGVGFFERGATVNGSAAAELRFRAQQINDILKSLVVQDLNGGTVGVVSYASKDPLERTLKSFAVDLTENPSLADLLGQLRGEPVEIAGPRQMKGTILGVEKQEIPAEKDRPPITVDCLNVLTDTGLQQLRIDQLQGVKLTNEKIDGELRKALTTLAGGHDADKKTVVIRFEGQGQRQVRASFLLEAPIWKTSYRLVLAPDKKPFLQGWATVENATEEDWNGVRLSLVSGRPISFQMDLYTPIYIPRPVEDLDLYASLRAPDFEAGFEMGGMGGGMGGLAMGGRPMQEGAERKLAAEKDKAVARGRAPAAAAQRPGSPAAPKPSTPAEEPEALDQKLAGVALSRMGQSGVQSAAAAKEAGELFEYVIQTPVTIPRQNSAMLAIVNQEIAGQKVSIFNPAAHPKHPLNGLLMENATDLNLMQGPVTVFDGDMYAGDAKLPDLKAGEKRLVAYALDMAVDVLIDAKPRPDELVSVRIAKGVLYHKHRYVDGRTYTANNKDKKDRTLVIEQSYSAGWTLLEPKEPFERTQSLIRFKMDVPAGKQAEQKVLLERVVDQTVAMSEVGPDAVQMYLKAPVVSPAVKAAMEKAIALRAELDQAGRERAVCEQSGKEAVEEQARIRENLKTIQQNTDTYQRQLQKFDALETQIEKLRGQLTALRQQEENKRQDLENYLLALNVE